MNHRYMRIFLALLLLPQLTFAAGASCDADFMRRCGGREFEVQHVLGSLVPGSAEGLADVDSVNVWDFTGASFSGLFMPLSFSSKADSVIYASTDRMRLSFALDSCSLHLLAKESPFTRVDYSPTVVVRAIAGSDAVCRSAYEANGRAFQSNFIYATGASETKLLNTGTLIRCEGDTIPDVCLDMRTSVERIYIGNAPCDSSFLATLPDSLFSVESNRIYTWRKQHDMTPLAQTVITSTYAPDGTLAYESSNSYIIFDLDDETPSVQSMRKRHTENGADGACADYHDGKLIIRDVYGESVSVMVTDILGRIYCKVDGLDASSGTVSIGISLSRGAYVAAVFSEAGVMSVKFAVE